MHSEDNSPAWFKSSRSESFDCVEIQMHSAEVLVRDSKQPAGHVLKFTHSEWRAFVDGVRLGEFDAPAGLFTS